MHHPLPSRRIRFPVSLSPCPRPTVPSRHLVPATSFFPHCSLSVGAARCLQPRPLSPLSLLSLLSLRLDRRDRPYSLNALPLALPALFPPQISPSEIRRSFSLLRPPGVWEEVNEGNNVPPTITRSITSRRGVDRPPQLGHSEPSCHTWEDPAFRVQNGTASGGGDGVAHLEERIL